MAHPYDKGITAKILIAETGCAPHIISYLTRLGRLPVKHESPGPGYPVVYNANAIHVVNMHLAKSGKQREEFPGLGSEDWVQVDL